MDLENHRQISFEHPSGINKKQPEIRDESLASNIDEKGRSTGAKKAARIQSSLAIKYSAEVSTIQQRWGDLEDIRSRLGLSQRKISQLLMVDPSAWTRWTKKNQKAPPHIYRALSWFLLLQEKHPEAHPNIWLASIATPKMPESQLLDTVEQVTARSLKQIERNLRQKRKRLWAKYKVFLAVSAFLAAISISMLVLST